MGRGRPRVVSLAALLIQFVGRRRQWNRSCFIAEPASVSAAASNCSNTDWLLAGAPSQDFVSVISAGKFQRRRDLL
jgi:hypothetical protein